MEPGVHSNAFALERRLYGRRQCRHLTPKQAQLLEARLPKLRLDPRVPAPACLSRLFDAPVDDVWLEIGFGGGEHLLFQAEMHPRIGFIGCEPFLNGVAKVLGGIESQDLKTIRIYDDDARHVLSWLPAESLGRVFVLFPDPWPKKRHRKRRFLSRGNLTAIAGAMRVGAQLRFATDIDDYAEMAVAEIETVPSLACRPGPLETPPADWPLTRYAEKAIAEKRKCSFFIFERI